MKRLAVVAALAACVGLAQAQPYAAWTKYRTVTVNTTNADGGANVASNQTNFPVLVRLTNTDEASGANVLSEALAGGADIRFTDSTGNVALAYEIESWSSSAAAIWVRVPVVAGNANTKLRLYWGRSGAPNASNPAGVFGDNDFLGVWHMGTASGSAARINAANPGTNDAKPSGDNAATMNPAAGIIGNADSLRSQDAGKEVDDHFDMGQITFPDSQVTVSMWMYLPGPQLFTNWTHFFTHGNTNLEDNLWIGREGTTNNLRARSAHGGNESGNAGSTTLQGGLEDLNTWMHVAVSKDSLGGRRWRLYKNGVKEIDFYNSNDNHKFVPGTRANNFIGRSLWSDRNAHFKVDEMRTSSIARSPDWVKLEYETQKSGATAVTLGAVVTPSAPALAYITKNATYVVNQDIQANTPVTSGTATGWSISPALPAGLSFNTSTGVITGKPTAASAAATYTVTATVGGTTATDNLTITVITGTPPAAPTGVTAVGGNGEATVSWNAGAAGTSPITSYVVTAVGDASKTCTWTTGPLSCKVTGLTNGTSYTFTVKAVSAVGEGPASQPSAAVIPAGAPAAPTDVKATQVSGAALALQVSWTAPTNTGGLPLTEYYVTGAPSGTCYAAAPSTSCTVYNVTAGTAYTFTVTAVNSGTHQSVASAPSTAVTPVGLAGAFAIQVTGAVKPYTFALTEEAMKSTSALTMSITDIHGRTVWSKTVNPSKDRAREVTWNGVSSSGRAVAAGVYMVRVSAVNDGKTSEIVRPTVK